MMPNELGVCVLLNDKETTNMIEHYQVKFMIISVALSLLLLYIGKTDAQVASSPNFSLQSSIVTAGGGSSASTNFSGISLLGQPLVGSASSTNFSVTTGALSDEILVMIDVKPGIKPNDIHLGDHKGVVPVAILTTPQFNASRVDTTFDENGRPRVVFSGALASVKGASGSYASLKDVDGDGDKDLVMQFPIANIDSSLFTTVGGVTVATLMGRTVDGRPISGRDTVNVVP